MIKKENKKIRKKFIVTEYAALNWILWIFSGQIASFKIGVMKVQDFRNFEFSSML